MPIVPRGHDEASARSRALAAGLPWPDGIDARWPVVLAYEHWRLRHELEEGRAYAAMVQLKDLAEVLIKLPAIVAARLLVEHGNDAQRTQARAVLVAPQPLSLGRWCEVGVRLAQGAAALPATGPLRPALALLVDERRRASALAAALRDHVVPWRNEELGHGALRLDLAESMREFEPLLHRLLGVLAAHDGAFDTLALHPEGAPGHPLTGAGALDDPITLAPLLAGRPLLPLHLAATGAEAVQSLSLGPYLCLKSAADTSGSAAGAMADTPGTVADIHAYLLNKRLRSRHDDGLHLLDYQTGNPAQVRAAEAGAMLQADLQAVPVPGAADDAAEGDLRDQAVRAFLDRVSFRRDYVEPDFLREWIAAFATDPARARGLAWLRGPGDVGKTLFSLGLDTQARGAGTTVLGDALPPPLAPDLQVVVVPLRREYRCTPLSIGWEVQRALDRAEDRESLSLGHYLALPEYRKDAPGALCAWLARVHAEAAERVQPGSRLLLVVDALDEIPPPETDALGGSIHRLMPPAQRLPEGVFLLLTSRDRGGAVADDCPAFVHEAIAQAWQASDEPLRTEYRLDPQANPYYRAVLRRYFDERTGRRFGGKAGAAFEQALQAAGHRFKALSYFAGLLEGGAAGPLDLAGLAAAPLAQHLAALQRHEGHRRWPLMRRILLELAAAEQAHEAEVAAMAPAPVGLDPNWLGLDLLELAERCGYPAAGPRALDVRLLHALYGLAELLRSYRGEAAASSRFALGLKGMREQLAALPDWQTSAALWRLLHAALAQCEAASGESAREAALLQAAGPAVALADRVAAVPAAGSVEPAALAMTADEADAWATAALGQGAAANDRYEHAAATRLATLAEALARLAHAADPSPTRLLRRAGCFSRRGVQRSGMALLSAALSDYGRAIDLGEEVRTLLGAQWLPEYRNDLADAYNNRGNALRASGNDAAAVADHGRAIELREELRELLGAHWPPPYRNDLATTYGSRGIALRASGDAAAAVADYGRAIELGEELRALLGAQWPPEYRNELARNYNNRGNALRASGDAATAVADCGRAIELREEVRALLGAQWPPAYRSALATAYNMRGDALRASGDTAAALPDYGRAIELREEVRALLGAQWPPAYRNALATAYLCRGFALRARGDAAAAVADYGRAIGLCEELRALMGAQWPPTYRNKLAAAYGSRGVVLHASGEADAARADFGRSIALREELRALMGAHWQPGYRNALARVYSNRGRALCGSGDAAAALADFGRSIALREELRALLGGQWPPAYRNDLANAYINRGNALRASGDAAAALADYGRAIALREELRAKLGAQWRPAYRNDLANTYSERGVALCGSGDAAAALADYGRAIELGEELRALLGAQWPPAYRNDLANTYSKRGAALSASGDAVAALADYRRAIELGEELRALLGAQWPPAYRNDLANTYSKRGAALSASGDDAAALADYDTALGMMDTLRGERSDGWTLQHRTFLAETLQGRAAVREQLGDAAGAADDRRLAQELRPYAAA